MTMGTPDNEENVSQITVIERSSWKNIRVYFREYCQCTSVHGFRYFGEKRTIFERIWWAVVFILCLVALIVSIRLVYNKWDSSPVIVSFATKATPLHHVPFPSVTICPESKAMEGSFNYSRVIEMINTRSPLSKEESKNFEYLSMICGKYPGFDYSATTNFKEDFFDVLNKIKPGFQATSCIFMEESYNCSELFVPVLTNEGICYSFNVQDKRDMYYEAMYLPKMFQNTNMRSPNWSLELGYDKDVGINVYPRRALYSGARHALQIILVTSEDQLGLSCNQVEGYKVVLHVPSRIPRPEQDYFMLPPDQAVLASVHPEMITTSDSVKMYDSKKRECYFLSEKKLRFFRTYSAKNCQMECLTNYTYNTLGCVNFFMPRTNTTPICGSGNVDRMARIEAKLDSDILKQSIIKENTSDSEEILQEMMSLHQCDCKPLCSDITYHAQVSQTNWDWERRLGKDRRLDRLADSPDVYMLHASSLTIYFKSSYFITSQRNELYGPTDFLANFGGLLGLFTGFSVLSLMEVIYFLSVRLWCNIRLYGQWAGPDHRE